MGDALLRKPISGFAVCCARAASGHATPALPTSALTIILIIAAPLARAETLEVGGDHGGFVHLYEQKWEKLAAQKVNIRIVGICASACTLLTGYFPRKDICVMPDAALGFQAGTFSFVTDELLRIYPEDIRKWIDAHGGLTSQLIWLQRPEIYKFFRKC
jgi:hypothetical protein